MLSVLRKRLRDDEKGFTLIELLVVVIILGILMAIAIPSYLKFRDKANDSAAKSNVTAAVPAMESYLADNGAYAANLAALQTIDPGVKNVVVVSASATAYCIKSTQGSPTYYIAGPGGDATTTACT